MDPERLAAVFGDDRDAIREILEMALHSMHELIGRAREAVASDDHAAASAAIHELKGMSANIGADELAKAATSAESALAEPAEIPSSLIEPLASAYERFAAAAKNLKERLLGD
ncbi:MAG TPA: Hpt domain-containing protein [Candidatus Acidoferrales bacterium]|nr:Hpt domain-containing protein [Candidatus Acidoferrales bacterium]